MKDEKSAFKNLYFNFILRGSGQQFAINKHQWLFFKRLPAIQNKFLFPDLRTLHPMDPILLWFASFVVQISQNIAFKSMYSKSFAQWHHHGNAINNANYIICIISFPMMTHILPFCQTLKNHIFSKLFGASPPDYFIKIETSQTFIALLGVYFQLSKVMQI